MLRLRLLPLLMLLVLLLLVALFARTVELLLHALPDFGGLSLLLAAGLLPSPAARYAAHAPVDYG